METNNALKPGGKFCWYKNCPVKRKNKENSKFTFPRYSRKYNSRKLYDEMLSQWVLNCGSDEVMSLYLQKNPRIHKMTICSLHFRPEDMYFNGRYWVLNRCAVPIDFRNPQSASLGSKAFPSVPIIISTKSETSISSSQEPFEFLDISCKAVKRESPSTSDLPLSPQNNEKRDVTSKQLSLAANNVLVNSDGIKIESSSTSPTDMKQDTIASTERQDGSPQEFCVIIEVQEPEVTKEVDGFRGFSSLKTESDLREFCGISLNTFRLLLSLLPSAKTYTNIHLSREDCLLSFLLQMKTGNSFALIKNLFCMSSVMEATWNFSDILLHLKNQTEEFIVWPDKQTVMNTMRDSFRKNFLDCRVMLYCLEVHLELPNQTYRWYTNPVKKILIGFTPSGAISFVSKVFSGDSTLMEVIVKSKIFDLLERKDFAFLIFDDNYHDISWNQLHEFVNENRILILLPSNHQNYVETNPTPQKTQIWVHAVNQIKRIKSHKILYNCCSERMNCLLENIVFMVCVLTNLQPLQESVSAPPRPLCFRDKISL